MQRRVEHSFSLQDQVGRRHIRRFLGAFVEAPLACTFRVDDPLSSREYQSNFGSIK